MKTTIPMTARQTTSQRAPDGSEKADHPRQRPPAPSKPKATAAKRHPPNDWWRYIGSRINSVEVVSPTDRSPAPTYVNEAVRFAIRAKPQFDTSKNRHYAWAKRVAEQRRFTMKSAGDARQEKPSKTAPTPSPTSFNHRY